MHVVNLSYICYDVDELWLYPSLTLCIPICCGLDVILFLIHKGLI